MKIAVTGKDGVGKTNLTRESFEYYLKEYFLQQFSACFFVSFNDSKEGSTIIKIKSTLLSTPRPKCSTPASISSNTTSLFPTIRCLINCFKILFIVQAQPSFAWCIFPLEISITPFFVKYILQVSHSM